MYTLLMRPIYLSLSAQVEEGTVFRKHMVMFHTFTSVDLSEEEACRDPGDPGQ